MPPDTSATMGPVNTPVWKFRVDPQLKDEAIRVAAAEDDNLTAVLIRAMRAYVADPQAFNAAVATIRGSRR